MLRSTDRIMVSHVGTLPRPPIVSELMAAGPDRDREFQEVLADAVPAIVRRQADMGIDIVNDGELPKRGGFHLYIRERMSGISQRPRRPEDQRTAGVFGRDKIDFPDYHALGLGGFGGASLGGPGGDPFFCTAALGYTGREIAERDIRRLKEASTGLDVQPYLPAVSPGTIEHWLGNDHYPDQESFLFAIADVMHEEYKAITDAGIILQVDDPDLPDAWQMFPDMSVADYRDYAALRVEAINRALEGISPEMVRHHCCWGSQHGPHKNDIPLRAIVDLVLEVNAECLAIEAANPAHEHEWALWEELDLPESKTLMPGAVGHVTDLIEHPELVAQRLIRYANIVGRERVTAGTDCGIGTRVGNGEIAWAKLQSLVDGAAIATKKLWGR